MIDHRFVALPSAVALILGGCSTAPRTFTAQLAAPAADAVAFDTTMATCRVLARQGVKSGFKDTALVGGAGAVGVVGGAAAATTAAATVGGTTAGFGGVGAAGAGAMTAGLLLVPLGIGFGVSRLIRSGKEGRLKKAMGGCMAENGYEVVDWSVARKPKKQTKATAVAAATPAVGRDAVTEVPR